MRPLSVPAASSDHGVDRVACRWRWLLSGRGPVPPASLNADAAAGFHHLVIARALDEHRAGRRIAAARRIDVGASADAIVEHDDGATPAGRSGQIVDLYVPEKPNALSPSVSDRLAGGRAAATASPADAHDALLGADVQAPVRLVHVDDTACEAEQCPHALVDDDHVGRAFTTSHIAPSAL